LEVGPQWEWNRARGVVFILNGDQYGAFSAFLSAGHDVDDRRGQTSCQLPYHAPLLLWRERDRRLPVVER
jgi:hypothetical protein